MAYRYKVMLKNKSPYLIHFVYFLVPIAASRIGVMLNLPTLTGMILPFLVGGMAFLFWPVVFTEFLNYNYPSPEPRPRNQTLDSMICLWLGSVIGVVYFALNVNLPISTD